MERAIIFGVFDLTHYGHYNKFAKVQEMGYKVIAGVVSDNFAESYKRKPILNEEERLFNMYACRHIDEAAICNTKESFKDIIKGWSINVIVYGSDWTREDYCKHMGFTEEWLKENELELISTPYTEGISTTEIIKRCKECR